MPDSIANHSNIDLVINEFKQQLKDQPLFLAFSGGMDSTVLLHALHRANIHFTAIHINHNLQTAAANWLQHCRDTSREYQIPFIGQAVHIEKTSRRGIEDLAREARYRAFWQLMPHDGVLITAHHQRDQVETLLMRLSRGTGLAGMTGMQVWQISSTGQTIARPLLNTPYDTLYDYAQRHQLNWVEDPTNAQADYAFRNTMRHQLLPTWEKITPSIQRQLVQFSRTCQESHELLSDFAQQDWLACKITEHSFSLASWRAHPWTRAKNMLQWQWHNLFQFRLEAKQWDEIYHQHYLPNNQDQQPLFCYRNSCFMVDTDKGYLVTQNILAQPTTVQLPSGSNMIETWTKVGRLSATLAKPIVVVPRKGGEQLVQRSQEQTKKRLNLKKWLQQQPYSAWQKRYWPVAYNHDGEVIGWANLPAEQWSVSHQHLTLEWLI